MGRDGSNNLRANINSEQFGLDDPRYYGFDDKRPQIREHMDQSLSSYKPARISLGPKNKIIATQDYVVPDKVQAMVEHKPSGGVPPLVMKVDDKHYVWDGHHRISAAIQRGQKSMNVRMREI